MAKFKKADLVRLIICNETAGAVDFLKSKGIKVFNAVIDENDSSAPYLLFKDTAGNSITYAINEDYLESTCGVEELLKILDKIERKLC